MIHQFALKNEEFHFTVSTSRETYFELLQNKDQRREKLVKNRLLRNKFNHFFFTEEVTASKYHLFKMKTLYLRDSSIRFKSKNGKFHFTVSTSRETYFELLQNKDQRRDISS